MRVRAAWSTFHALGFAIDGEIGRHPSLSGAGSLKQWDEIDSDWEED